MSIGPSGTLAADASLQGIPLPRYVLISPARNEAAFIEKTIQSMVAQTYLPLRWVIVSDGSTDGTDEIVKRYLPDHPWMELVRMPERKERHFAGKVHAFNAGREKVENLDYDVIGNVDTDVSFGADFFEFLMAKFAENPGLGVAGAPFREGTRQYDFRRTSVEHVSGAVQMFRRECFQEIGGYRPIKTGGVDLVAVITARMKGWQTRTFLERYYDHYRKMSSAKRNIWGIAFDAGRTDYTHGCDPVWEIFRCCYQVIHAPVVWGGTLCLLGYFWAAATRQERVVSADFVRFRKTEQMRRLRHFFKQLLPYRQSGTQRASLNGRCN